MSAVSDNWAALEAMFAGLDIQRYFDGFAISEVLGCRKPDPGCTPREAVFLGLSRTSACSLTTTRNS
jgi:putative hydrolase of the HAD superfamily